MNTMNTIIKNNYSVSDHKDFSCDTISSLSLENFLCPICRELLINPIVADDGFFYNEECFKTLTKNKKQIQSPMTKKIITDNYKKVPQIKNILLELLNSKKAAYNNTYIFRWNNNIYESLISVDICNIINCDLLEQYLLEIDANCCSTNEKKKIYTILLFNIMIRYDKFTEKNKISNILIKFITNNKMLIDHKYVNDESTTLLIAAFNTNSEDIAIKILDDSDVDYNWVDNKGNTALIYACRKKWPAIILKLLEKPDIDYNIIDNKDNTPLLYAVKYEMDNVALTLLNKEDIDCNHIDKNYATSILIYTCGNNNEIIALELLKKPNINYNYIDHEGDTAFLVACCNNLYKVATELLKKPNINYNHIDKNGYSALMYACEHNMSEIVAELLNMQNINTNKYEKTGLILDTEHKLSDVTLKMLNDFNINHNYINTNGDPILILAKQHEKLDVVLKLLNSTSTTSTKTVLIHYWKYIVIFALILFTTYQKYNI